MREALSNLIDNAIKFTPEGGVVRVMAGMESGQPVIRVCDNGAGVPSEARERIFDRYFRADRANSSRGSGVGLSIATAIAHLHGLDLRVIDNNPGARFELFRASPSPKAPPFSGKMAL
jgi:signal transduction histidine kinase